MPKSKKKKDEVLEYFVVSYSPSVGKRIAGQVGVNTKLYDVAHNSFTACFPKANIVAGAVVRNHVVPEITKDEFFVAEVSEEKAIEAVEEYIKEHGDEDVIGGFEKYEEAQNETTNYLKMDGEKANFQGGAIRYTKNGKGRFDLIPGDVIVDVLNTAWENFYAEGDMTTSKFDIIQMAFASNNAEKVDRSHYIDTIINLVNFIYTDGIYTTDGNGIESKETSFDNFLVGFSKMLHDLAVHYECGAEKYGVDNWKKGIPVTGGDRGGSFTDSGLRHLNQWCQGLTDEPHHIACIWNFFGCIWSINNDKVEKSNKKSDDKYDLEKLKCFVDLTGTPVVTASQQRNDKTSPEIMRNDPNSSRGYSVYYLRQLFNMLSDRSLLSKYVRVNEMVSWILEDTFPLNSQIRAILNATDNDERIEKYSNVFRAIAVYAISLTKMIGIDYIPDTLIPYECPWGEDIDDITRDECIMVSLVRLELISNIVQNTIMGYGNTDSMHKRYTMYRGTSLHKNLIDISYAIGGTVWPIKSQIF